MADPVRDAIRDHALASGFDAVGFAPAHLEKEACDAFGEDDAYVTVELPDNVSAAAVGMAVGASGMVTSRTVVLLTPEEIDKAAKTQLAYRAPGS